MAQEGVYNNRVRPPSPGQHTVSSRKQTATRQYSALLLPAAESENKEILPIHLAEQREYDGTALWLLVRSNQSNP
jgi:hypothetical protein